MNLPFLLLSTALAVAPADRFALADRLFNKGEHALAATEYAALQGEKSIASDALLYRLAECDRALGKNESAQARFKKLLSDFPTSSFADTARLRLALASSAT